MFMIENQSCERDKNGIVARFQISVNAGTQFSQAVDRNIVRQKKVRQRIVPQK
jgi:hypothetical protein